MSPSVALNIVRINLATCRRVSVCDLSSCLMRVLPGRFCGVSTRACFRQFIGVAEAGEGGGVAERLSRDSLLEVAAGECWPSWMLRTSADVATHYASVVSGLLCSPLVLTLGGPCRFF
ncbi:unnamed protein product, partial [Amoebophrya sp. A25]|eukprot:GSA25T00027179001.1